MSRGINFGDSFESNSREDNEGNDGSSIESRFGFHNQKPNFNHFKHDFPMNGYNSRSKPFHNQFKHHEDCDHEFGFGPGPNERFTPGNTFAHGGNHHEHSWHNFDHGKSLLGSLFRIFIHVENPFDYNNAKRLEIAPWKISWFFTGFGDSISPKPLKNENNFNENFPGRDNSNEINKSGKHHFDNNRNPTKKPSISKPSSSSRPSTPPPPPPSTAEITTEKTTTSTLFPKIDIRSAL